MTLSATNLKCDDQLEEKTSEVNRNHPAVFTRHTYGIRVGQVQRTALKTGSGKGGVGA